MGFFDKLKQGLSKTKGGFTEKLVSTLSFGRKIDEELYEELEEQLILADIGVETALDLVERLRQRVKSERISDAGELKQVLQEEIAAMLEEGADGLEIEANRLNIWLVVGVNGAGKTTTIGKMAHYLKSQKHKVLLAAADTFRAAAIDQLVVWGERAGVDVIRQQQGADPGAVVFDACQAAVSRNSDILLVDTAGRLQNKANLMEELRKIDRIIQREAPDAKVETLLVLDAGTGQNAISQAKLFGEVVPLTGIILTKLDGTAKGGVTVGIKHELQLPVRMIGVGEGIDDLQPFVPQDFVKALFE